MVLHVETLVFFTTAIVATVAEVESGSTFRETVSVQFSVFGFYYVFCIKYHKAMQCSQVAIASRGEHCLQIYSR